MLVVTDAIVEAFVGVLGSDFAATDADLDIRVRSALEAIMPMFAEVAAEAPAMVSVETMVDQLANDHYSVWTEPSAL